MRCHGDAPPRPGLPRCTRPVPTGAGAAQEGALAAFATDFEIWKNKRAALKVMQLKTDGPFNTVRKWVSQFYMPREQARQLQQELNGVYPVLNFPQPSEEIRNRGNAEGLFGG